MTGTATMHEAARAMVRAASAAGTPVSAAELGARFRRSDRWGRERIAEVRGEAPETADDQPEPVAETITEPASAEVITGYQLPDSLRSLKRVRAAVRAALALGVAASVAGNVLHASGGVISQVIAAWSPLALLITVELISRVPVHRRSLAVARWLATAVIASIAAWVSYVHMVDVAIRYGETGAAPYLLPLSVDGLVVVASICLVELGGRIRSAELGGNS